jgi:hypothetical protein
MSTSRAGSSPAHRMRFAGLEHDERSLLARRGLAITREGDAAAHHFDDGALADAVIPHLLVRFEIDHETARLGRREENPRSGPAGRMAPCQIPSLHAMGIVPHPGRVQPPGGRQSHPGLLGTVLEDVRRQPAVVAILSNKLSRWRDARADVEPSDGKQIPHPPAHLTEPCTSCDGEHDRCDPAVSRALSAPLPSRTVGAVDIPGTFTIAAVCH